MKKTAYSYIRFSSPEQAKGDSFRRQLSRTIEFCEKHDLQLSDTRFADLGVSGWTGKNIERGAMGDFLAAVKAGKIKPGSVLIVENFDRFSRLKPRVAYAKLGEIIETGVDVVTLEDGKIHTKETLDDFATLISSLAIMQRANEESSRKSSMIRASWAQKRKLAIADNKPLTNLCPMWLRPKADGSGFEIIPDRAKLVRRIFKMAKEGKGKREIMRIMNLEKIPVWGRARRWHETYLYLLLSGRQVLGELQPTFKREADGPVLKNYYPAVIEEATWAAVQRQRTRPTAGPATGVNNLFSGLLFDGYHPEHPMLFICQNRKNGYCYLQSDYARVDPLRWKAKRPRGAGRMKGGKTLSIKMIRYPLFEKHFLQHFENIDFHETMPVKTKSEASPLAQFEAEQAENTKALSNLIKALEGGKESALVMTQLEKREAAGKRLEKQIEVETLRLKHENHAADSFGEEQQRLAELIEATTTEARLALRSLFHRIVERIDIYAAGLFDVPDHLKTTVYPDRYGMMCYSIKLVGGHKMWIWWDGCQSWDEK
jgi:DNA invertase Pin-like site-specific DNA recombinase